MCTERRETDDVAQHTAHVCTNIDGVGVGAQNRGKDCSEVPVVAIVATHVVQAGVTVLPGEHHVVVSPNACRSRSASWPARRRKGCWR